MTERGEAQSPRDGRLCEEEKYAIAIEDSGELFLFLNIKRGVLGDIYVNFNEHHPSHKPHSSFHASGQLHHKSDNHKVLPIKMLQPPNNKFTGSTNIITTCIRHGDGRAWNEMCKRDDYTDVMVIKDANITPQFGYQLAIDLVQFGDAPVGYDKVSINIIQQRTFKHNKPLIVASLFEVLSTKTKIDFGENTIP